MQGETTKNLIDVSAYVARGYARVGPGSEWVNRIPFELHCPPHRKAVIFVNVRNQLNRIARCDFLIITKQGVDLIMT